MKSPPAIQSQIPPNPDRVIGLDIHPDTFAAAIVEGRGPLKARVSQSVTRASLPSPVRKRDPARGIGSKKLAAHRQRRSRSTGGGDRFGDGNLPRLGINARGYLLDVLPRLADWPALPTGPPCRLARLADWPASKVSELIPAAWLASGRSDA